MKKEGIVKLTYGNKNMIIYNTDYHIVHKTVDTLNSRSDDLAIKYTFKNQRMSKSAMQCFGKEFGSITLSTMNKSGDYIFHSEFIRNRQFNGCFSANTNQAKFN